MIAVAKNRTLTLLIYGKVVQHDYGTPNKVAQLPGSFGPLALSQELPAPTLDAPAYCIDAVHQIAYMELMMNNQATEAAPDASAQPRDTGSRCARRH